VFRCTNPYLQRLTAMQLSTKTFRDYQVRLVTDVCRAIEDVLVEQPTGSDKTVQKEAFTSKPTTE
jgi:hypothetical protein